MPTVRPVNGSVVVVPFVVDAVMPPGFAVTVYFVIALEPFVAGAVQLTVAPPGRFATAETAVGAASGVVAARIGFDGTDALLGPMAFDAVTVKVYSVPGVRPVTTALVAVGPAFVAAPVEPVGAIA